MGVFPGSSGILPKARPAVLVKKQGRCKLKQQPGKWTATNIENSSCRKIDHEEGFDFGHFWPDLRHAGVLPHEKSLAVEVSVLKAR